MGEKIQTMRISGVKNRKSSYQKSSQMVLGKGKIIQGQQK